MNKKFSFYIFFNLICIFSLFLCNLFAILCENFTPPPKKLPYKQANATDVSATELELQEYQNFEHGIYTSLPKADFDTDSKFTDTPKNQNYTIVIDAGHGGPDPGSIGYKTKVLEADLNLKMSLLLKTKLEKAGISVIMTRETSDALASGRGKAFKKKDMELRKAIINKVRPNMVISLHQNSFVNHTLRGAQVFYDKSSNISKQIAETIQKEFIENLDFSNKTVSPGNYYMLKCTASPSVIVECGFLSHPEEEKLLQDETYQEKIVNSICKGVLNFIMQSN